MKKSSVLLIALTTALLLSGAGVSELSTKKELIDISAHWGKEAIEGAVAKGYVDGYEDNSFKPDHAISRAEFVKMVSAAIGDKVESKGGDGWYIPYVEDLKAEGILPVEFPDNYNEPLARFEMAIIGTKAIDKDLRGSMADATRLGVIHGVGTNNIAPYETSTRAQAVTVIERILTARKGEQLPVDVGVASVAAVEQTGSNANVMLGMDPIGLNQETFLWGAKVTLKELIIADPMNPADPYIGMFDVEAWLPSTKKLEETHIVALKFEIVVDERSNPEMSVGGNRDFSLSNSAGFVRFTNQDTDYLRKVYFNEPGVYTGWVANYYHDEFLQYGIKTYIGPEVVSIAVPK
jgi:hypothetical protein